MSERVSVWRRPLEAATDVYTWTYRTTQHLTLGGMSEVVDAARREDVPADARWSYGTDYVAFHWTREAT